jgi:hypothetical protein
MTHYNPKTYFVANEEWAESLETNTDQAIRWLKEAERRTRARLSKDPSLWPMSNADAAAYRRMNRARFERLKQRFDQRDP